MNTAIVKILIMLVVSPILILALHAVVSRYFTRYKPAVSRQIVCAICILIGHIPMAMSLWYFVMIDVQEALPTILYSLVVYNAIGYSYFHIFNMSETARRIRLLYELYLAGQLKSSDISSSYNPQDILLVRIDRLISMGQIKQADNRYMLDGYFLYYVAKVVVFWANLIKSPMMKLFVR